MAEMLKLELKDEIKREKESEPRGVRASEYWVRGVPLAEMLKGGTVAEMLKLELKVPLELKLPYPPVPTPEGRRAAVADPWASVERFCFAAAGARTSNAPPPRSSMPDLSVVTGDLRCC